ncbi:hypothetical protein BBJ28_00007119 [Nothophytophthora sp. Chile5]|nr:hypothetical protein BBJ28_00007119 [Nothophytophthora sp. Chile5]
MRDGVPSAPQTLAAVGALAVVAAAGAGLPLLSRAVSSEARLASPQVEASLKDVRVSLFRAVANGDSANALRLVHAVQQSHNGAERLLQLFSSRNGAGHTVLIQAAKRDMPELCRFLLDEAGADVNQRDVNGKTALETAATSGFESVTRLFLERGADSESKDKALIVAAHFGHLAVMKTLLQHGANARFANKNGTTALMRASQRGMLVEAQLLLEKGAEVWTANVRGCGLSAKLTLDLYAEKEMLMVWL